MYNCDITIVPSTSSCIDRIEWNSQAKAMCVFYVDNDQCYDYEDINWNDMLDLESKALVMQSWGKALNRWKIDRELKFLIQAKENFQNMWDNLHDTDKVLYTKWAQEAREQDYVNEKRGRFYKR